MKRIWSYIVFLLGGALIGVIFAVKYLTGYTVNVDIKKLKNKRVGSSDTTIPISIEQPQNRWKRTKEERKADRLNKKN